MSRLTEQPASYRRYYLQAVHLLAWLVCPAVAAAAGCSSDLIRVCLGPDWEPTADIFKVLALASLFQGTYSTMGWIFISLGRTARMFRWTWVAVPVMVVSFAVGLPWDSLGVAAAYTTVFLLFIFPWTFLYTLKDTPIGFGDLMRVHVNPLLVAGVVFAVTQGMASHGLGDTSPALRLTLSLAAAAAIGLGVIFIVPSLRRDILAQLAHLRELVGRKDTASAV